MNIINPQFNGKNQGLRDHNDVELSLDESQNYNDINMSGQKMLRIERDSNTSQMNAQSLIYRCPDQDLERDGKNKDDQ